MDKNAEVNVLIPVRVSMRMQTYMFMHVYENTHSKNVCIKYVSAMYNFTDLWA